MKRISIVALIALSVAVTSAAAQQKKLRAGIDGTFAPHAMPNLQGQLEGFNVDLVKELEKKFGEPIQLDSVQFSGLIPGLQSGVYDFIAAPVTVNEDRAKSLLFTEGFMNTDFQFVIPKAAPEVKSFDDLKGKKIAVNRGSTYDLWARDLAGKHGWTVESYNTTVDVVQAVTSARADTALLGNTVAAWSVLKNPAIKLSLVHSTGLVLALPVRKDNVALRERIELAFECMKKEGIIAKLHEKWFGYAPASDSAAVVIYPGFGVPGMPGYDEKPHELKCG